MAKGTVELRSNNPVLRKELTAPLPHCPKSLP